MADEILFQAKISPHRLGSEFKLADGVKLRKMILTVVEKAVALNTLVLFQKKSPVKRPGFSLKKFFLTYLQKTDSRSLPPPQV